MWQMFADAFNLTGLVPHGFCLKWNPLLLWTLVGSDALIALSYFSIPFAIWFFANKRPDVRHRWVFILFGLFIVACGATHLLDVVIIWQPNYWANAMAKAVTAVLSLGTAVFIWYIMPAALRAPSVQQLEQAKAELETLNAELEQRIQGRTEALIHSNKQLQTEKALLRSLIDNIPDYIFIKDSEGAYLACNKAVEGFLGAPESEIIGKTDFDFVDASTAEFFRQKDKETLESNSICVNDEVITHADGQQFYLETIKIPFMDERQKIVGLIGVGRNISERKQAEMKLQLAAKVFSHASEGIMITDASGTIIDVNNTFTLITGYNHDEAVGQNPRMLSSGRHDKAFYVTMWEQINNQCSWVGEIWNRRKNGDIYPEFLTIAAVKDGDGKLTNYIGTLMDISTIKAAEQEIERLAFYDPLTGLANRRLFTDRLRQGFAASNRSGHEGALLYLDIDNFKMLNDAHGHRVGDLLLQEVATRLGNCVREGDTVARLGGDEFVIMLIGLSEESVEAAGQAKFIGHKILRTLEEPFQLEAHRYNCTSSIGIVLFKGQQEDKLLQPADIAMYQAKKAGGNTLRFFDENMQKTITKRVNLERELREAIEQQQFELYYQVQTDSFGCPIGAEALIRWNHPERGVLSPIEFIPLAEETGLILPIGHWVLETACAQLKAWQQDAPTRNLVLSVNVSAKQFYQADFISQVQAVVSEHAVNPILLELELTESLLLDNVENTVTTMNRLKAIGIRFSLDDFGTGYSSLQYLKRLPLDQLKIDQSFVRDIVSDYHDLSIVRTIISMAQSLELDVIAEGVEMEDQWRLLLNKGCTHFQGYLFGKPVPLEQFETLINKV